MVIAASPDLEARCRNQVGLALLLVADEGFFLRKCHMQRCLTREDILIVDLGHRVLLLSRFRIGLGDIQVDAA